MEDQRKPLIDGENSLNSAPAKKGPPEPAICRCCPVDVLPLAILFCICWLTFGSYWVFDTPGAIFSQLQDWFGESNYSHSDNLNLYSVYSWPNTVLAFFGGYIIDRWTGVRGGALLFCFLVLAGQGVFSVGVQIKSYWLCFAGRFIFGLGGENLTVAQNAFTVRWFEGKDLALAFGLVLAFARIGSSVNFVVTPILADGSEGVPFSVWFGTGTCLISLFACVAAAGLDWYGQDRLAAKEKEGEPVVEEPPLSLRAAAEFPLAAWLLFFICLFFYIGVLTFNTVASDIMQNTGNYYSADTATIFLSIPNFLSVIASPLFGWMVDKVGHPLTFVGIGSFMLIIGQLVFLGLAEEWYIITPIPIMIWIGIGYSLGAAAFWPTLPKVIDPKALGFAYGTATAVQNFGLALFPMLIGFLQDTGGIKDTHLMYTLPILIFIGCEGVALLLCIWVIRLDQKVYGGRVNGPPESQDKESEVILQKDSDWIDPAGEAPLVSDDKLIAPAPMSHISPEHSGEDLLHSPIGHSTIQARKERARSRGFSIGGSVGSLPKSASVASYLRNVAV